MRRPLKTRPAEAFGRCCDRVAGARVVEMAQAKIDGIGAGLMRQLGKSTADAEV